MNAIAKYARVSVSRFKPGKREEGNKVLEGFLREEEEGYKGFMILFSLDDPDRATYVTWWDTEKAMIDSLKNNKEAVIKALGDLTAGPTEMHHSKIQDMQIR